MVAVESLLKCAFRFVSDTRGATAAMMGVVLATLIGFAGLGVETGLWFSEKRHYQTAADAAALSGAFQLAAQIPNVCSGGTTATNMTPIRAAATTMATANGYAGPTAVGGSTVPTTEKLYVNSPPASGVYSGNKCAVEAILYEPKNSLFAAVYQPSVTIGVRSVALVKFNFLGGACDLALNPNAGAPSGNGNVAGINIAGTATVNQPNCAMASNSTNSCSFSTNGNPTVNIADIYTAGGDCLGSNTTISTNGTVPVTGGDPIPDPFASMFPNNPSMPSGAGCPGATAIQNPSNTTIQPGTYSSITLTSGGPYTLATGTYYICSSSNGASAGQFQSSVQVNTASGGATIIVQGQISVTGSGTMSAPLVSQATSTYPYPGILFYQPGDGSNHQQDTINGGSNLVLTGAIYLPGGNLTFSGTNATGSTACLEIVSYTIQFIGTSGLTNTGCSADNINKILITNVVMGE